MLAEQLDGRSLVIAPPALLDKNNRGSWPNVFDDFYRADNALKVEPDGTGLGLSIVRQIIENNRGQIFVDSELGQGTTFTIYLPGASK
mgnify:CR=1 FL=1